MLNYEGKKLTTPLKTRQETSLPNQGRS